MDTETKLGIAELALVHLGAWGWIYAAGVAVPFAAYRLMQWYKLDAKARTGKKPPARTLIARSFVIVALGSYYCLAQHFGRWDHQIVFGGLMIACLNAVAVQLLFVLGGQGSGKVAAAMSGELYSDDATNLKTMIGAVVGTKVKTNKRKADAEFVGPDLRA